jgi:hypothetical protein
MRQLVSSSPALVALPARPGRAIRLLWLACAWLVATAAIGRTAGRASVGACALAWLERVAGQGGGRVCLWPAGVSDLGTQPWALAPLATPAMVTGAWLGERMFGVLDRPTDLKAKALLLLAVAVPLLTGVLDLYLRMHTL